MAKLTTTPVFTRGVNGGETSAEFKDNSGFLYKVSVGSDGAAVVVSVADGTLEKFPSTRENHVQYIKEIVRDWDR